MDNELQKAVGYIPATDFEDYNDWLGMMGNFKAAGLTLEDFTHWSSASPKSLSTNKLILIAPCAILSSRKNNGGKHGNDKAENMGNNG